MTKGKLKISEEDRARIVEAIKKAELNTSGEIRVHIQEILIGDIFEEAKNKFEELGMTKTEKRNGTLIFISTKERQMAILGDEGINKVVPEGFWRETVDMMIGFFKKDDLVGGIEAGVLKAGDALKKYFPYQSDDKNELDNDVSVG